MAQNIGIYLVSSLHNETIKKDYLNLDFAGIHEIASQDSSATEIYPWITSVDEYGHTYINHFQATHLASEIERLKLTPELQAEANKIIEVLKKLDGEQLVYFDGD